MESEDIRVNSHQLTTDRFESLRNSMRSSNGPTVIVRMGTSRACGRGILLGLAEYNRLHGHWRLIQEPPAYVRPGGDRIPWPENWAAHGIIVSRPDVPQDVIASGVPIIGIDVRQPIPDLPNIVGDAKRIAKMAAGHFLERGFRHFAYCGFQGIRWAIERGDCFIRYLSESGYSPYTSCSTNIILTQVLLQRLIYGQRVTKTRN